MTDDLHKRAEEIVGAMTPGPWHVWAQQPDVAIKSPTGLIANVDVWTGGGCYDASGIAFLRNMAEATQAVVRAAKILRVFLDEEIGMDKTELTLLRSELAAYDAALAKELGP